MTHFSTNLQESMTWFRKHHPQMDLNFHNDTVSEELDDHHNYYNTNDPMATNSQHYFYSNQPTVTATASSTACQINNNEPMFEKPLTPSDVGKLNRLVIPKQHAEKYFPLNRTNFINNVDDSTSPPSSGTLLTFEDESGKSWKFRYSYWNSSQSYVLTKGWSRYVKEKRLDAGDVVFFQRDMGSLDRLFIGWRRRTGDGCRTAVQDSKSSYGSSGHVIRGGGYGGQDSLYSGCSVGQLHGLEFGIAPPPPYRPDHCFHAGTAMQLSQTPGDGSNSNSNSNTNPRRLIRLFGVNFECQQDDSQTTSLESTSSLSSQHHSVPSSSSVYGGNYFDYDGTNNVYHRNHFHHQMGV